MAGLLMFRDKLTILTLFQEGLARARLVKWTKGFNCAGVEGEDVVQLLQEAIARRGDVKIEVCAILNDTTGRLEFDFCWRQGKPDDTGLWYIVFSGIYYAN